MRASHLSIRPATPADLPTILAFVRGLAAYERLAHEAVATEADFDRALFGATPHAEVVIAEWEGAPVGFALFFGTFSTFTGRPGLWLEDLFVVPEARGRGIGTALLVHLARLAVARGCTRFEWSVLDWNEDAIRVYRALGAVGKDDWTTQRVDGAALQALAGRPSAADSEDAAR